MLAQERPAPALLTPSGKRVSPLVQVFFPFPPFFVPSTSARSVPAESFPDSFQPPDRNDSSQFEASLPGHPLLLSIILQALQRTDAPSFSIKCDMRETPSEEIRASRTEIRPSLVKCPIRFLFLIAAGSPYALGHPESTEISPFVFLFSI